MATCLPIVKWVGWGVRWGFETTLARVGVRELRRKRSLWKPRWSRSPASQGPESDYGDPKERATLCVRHSQTSNTQHAVPKGTKKPNSTGAYLECYDDKDFEATLGSRRKTHGLIGNICHWMGNGKGLNSYDVCSLIYHTSFLSHTTSSSSPGVD